MPFTLNGCGTSYYGRKELSDGTYLTTEWIVYLWVPLIPLRSFRIVKAGPRSGMFLFSNQQFVTQKIPLNMPIVYKVYRWAAPVSIALFAFLGWVIYSNS